MTRQRTSIWGAVLIGALLVGCQSVLQPEEPSFTDPGSTIGQGGKIGPGVSTASLATARASKWIGATGGTIVSGNYMLVIPPGALTVSTLITLDQETPGEWPVHLGPDGTTFNVPVTLSMDASGEPDPDSLNIYWWNPDTEEWVMQITTHVGGVASTSVDHFSRYGFF